MPIHIKIKETAELYNILRGNRYKNFQIDHDEPPRQCLHPTDRITATDTDNTQENETPINIYTDGSKSEQGVGAGIVIKRPGNPNCQTDVQNGHQMHQQSGGGIRNTKGAG